MKTTKQDSKDALDRQHPQATLSKRLLLNVRNRVDWPKQLARGSQSPQPGLRPAVHFRHLVRTKALSALHIFRDVKHDLTRTRTSNTKLDMSTHMFYLLVGNNSRGCASRNRSTELFTPISCRGKRLKGVLGILQHLIHEVLHFQCLKKLLPFDPALLKLNQMQALLMLFVGHPNRRNDRQNGPDRLNPTCCRYAVKMLHPRKKKASAEGRTDQQSSSHDLASESVPHFGKQPRLRRRTHRQFLCNQLNTAMAAV